MLLVVAVRGQLAAMAAAILLAPAVMVRHLLSQARQ
jgi:hypothetical protein